MQQTDKTLDQFQYASDCKIRQQDVDTIDAVEKRLEFGAGLREELLVAADRPALKVRKRIEAMPAQEND